MSWKKRIGIIILIILIAGIAFVAYEYTTTTPQENIMVGDHKVLLLTADPSEKRPGIGGVDMAFVISTHNGKIGNVTPVYPGTLTHPTASPPEYLKSMGVNKLYLHDALWDADVDKDAKLAQEIVEYNTGLKTDSVVIVTPDAVNAIIKTIGPITVNGQTVNGDSINFLREEQNASGMSRGNAVEGMMNSILNATKDPNKYNAVLKTAAVEYTKGTIVVVPKDLFVKLLISNGLQYLT